VVKQPYKFMIHPKLHHELTRQAKQYNMSTSTYLAHLITTGMQHTALTKNMQAQAKKAYAQQQKTVMDDFYQYELGHVTLYHNLCKKLLKIANIVTKKEMIALTQPALNYARDIKDKKLTGRLLKLRQYIQQKGNFADLQQVAKELKIAKLSQTTKEKRNGELEDEKM